MKLNKKNLKLRKKIVRVIDKMIPEEQYKILPKASKAINVQKFIDVISKNKSIKKIIETDCILNKVKEFENLAGEELLKFYFSSQGLRKNLRRHTSKRLKSKKKPDIYNLIENLENSKTLLYKDIRDYGK